MSAAANKKLMEEIFAAAGNPDPAVRDRSLFVASLADDAKWVVTGQYSWSHTFTGKESILGELHGHVRSLLVERAHTIAHRFIADGDHVVVEAKGDNLTRTGAATITIIVWFSGWRMGKSARSGNIVTRC
jgi:uncharacterized protein